MSISKSSCTGKVTVSKCDQIRKDLELKYVVFRKKK